MAPGHGHEILLGLVELPAGGDEAAVLVAVRVAQHHLLLAAPAVQQAPVEGQGQQAVQDGAAAAQVLDGLEERDQVDIQAPLRGPEQADLPQQHRGLQQVRDALGVADDAVGQGRQAQALLGAGHGAEEAQLSLGLFAVGQEGRGQGARARQLRRQQGDARLLVQGQVAGARLEGLQQFGHHPAVDL